MPDAIVLCGGAGLRLRSVIGSAPKGMAEVAGRPFLEVLLCQLSRHGFERVILAVGYQNAVIQSHFGERWLGLELLYSVESQPLGTGGALLHAAHLVRSSKVLVMNGDSYTDVSLSDFAAKDSEIKADASMVLTPAEDRADCGSVLVREDGRVKALFEKHRPVNGAWVNAGIYLASRQMIEDIPANREISLEKELFPRWLEDGKYIHGFTCSGRCIDIGTPERYQTAQADLATVELASNCGGRI